MSFKRRIVAIIIATFLLSHKSKTYDKTFPRTSVVIKALRFSKGNETVKQRSTIYKPQKILNQYTNEFSRFSKLPGLQQDGTNAKLGNRVSQSPNLTLRGSNEGLKPDVRSKNGWKIKKSMK